MTKPIQVKNIILGEGMPKICVPLTESKSEEICTQAVNAKTAGAELVEWRADFYCNLCNEDDLRDTLEELIRVLDGIPLIFTIRTKKEGGNAELSTEEYIRINLTAARTKKADFVDVEVFGEEEEKKSLILQLQKEDCRVIASSHDFEKTEEKEALVQRFKRMDETGADILKIAVMPKNFEDVAAIMQATKEMCTCTSKPLISMSMGSIGSISRIAGENFGSCLTFATVGTASAPGQFPIQELRVMMEALHQENRRQETK